MVAKCCRPKSTKRDVCRKGRGRTLLNQRKASNNPRAVLKEQDFAPRWNYLMIMATSMLRALTFFIPCKVPLLRMITDLPIPWFLCRLVANVHIAPAQVPSAVKERSEWCFLNQANFKPTLLNEGDLAGVSRVLLYIHGGAFCLCNPRSHRELVSRLCRYVSTSGDADNRNEEANAPRQCEIPLVLTIWYDRPPENPYPGPIQDCLAAYQWLLGKLGDSGKIILAGDSAGGALCLELMVKLRKLNLPQPAGAVLMSPWVDLADASPSMTENIKWDYVSTHVAKLCAELYAGHFTFDEASVINRDFKGLPPLHVTCGERERLRDQIVRFASKARADGVDVSLHVAEDMTHAFQIFAFTSMPQPARSYEMIATFTQERWERAVPSNC